MKPVIEFECKDVSGKKEKIVSCQYLLNDKETANNQLSLSSKNLSKLVGDLGEMRGVKKIDYIAKELSDLTDSWKCNGKVVNSPFRINYLQGLNAAELCNVLNDDFEGFTGSENAFPLGGSEQICVEKYFINDLKDSNEKCEIALNKKSGSKCSKKFIGNSCLNALAGEYGVKTASTIIKKKFRIS